MRSETVTTTVPAPCAEVFRYLADIENFPDWATEFAREDVVLNGADQTSRRA